MTKVTKKQLASRIYAHQKEKSRQRGHQAPAYSRDELLAWMDNNPNFDNLYNRWARSGFKRNLAPSVDRLDNSKGYTFQNIELTSWDVNAKRAYRDMRTGTIVREYNAHRPVIVYNDQGEKLFETISMCGAQRRTGVNRGRIFKACREASAADGYTFRYKYGNPKYTWLRNMALTNVEKYIDYVFKHPETLENI